jgi:hypothetical protein
MRRFSLVLVFCLGVGGLTSCSTLSKLTHQSRPAQTVSKTDSKTDAPVTPEAPSQSDVGVYDSGVSSPKIPASSSSTSYQTSNSSSKVTSPSWQSSSLLPIRDEATPVIDDEDSPVSTEPLPGDFRGGLRTPSLPDTLPMTLDGKVNSMSL